MSEACGCFITRTRTRVFSLWTPAACAVATLTDSIRQNVTSHSFTTFRRKKPRSKPCAAFVFTRSSHWIHDHWSTACLPVLVLWQIVGCLNPIRLHWSHRRVSDSKVLVHCRCSYNWRNNPRGQSCQWNEFCCQHGTICGEMKTWKLWHADVAWHVVVQHRHVRSQTMWLLLLL